MEKSLWLWQGSIQRSTSTCWNFEQLSMGSSGVNGPHQTVVPNGSMQWIQWSDLGSLRIATLRASGRAVQVARGCSTFHPISRALPDRPQSGRWSQSPWLKIISGALGKSRGKRLRATVGLLRDRLIAPHTLVKYRASTAAFFSFCSNAGYPKPHTATEMDLRFCEFVQHAWEECDSRNILADARSGLVHFISSRQLHGSQRLPQAWCKNELPMRADPFPINFLLAMVGAALEAQKLRIAVSL